MAHTLLELTNRASALQIDFECEIKQNEEKITALQQCNSKLHKGMLRQVTSMQRVIAKAAEADAKRNV